MKKKIANGAFIGVFLTLSLLLSLGMLLFGPAQPSANERLSEFPVLVTEDGKLNPDFAPQLASYVNDRFFLRQQLITADRWLSAKLLGTSTENNVLLGADGWLFYGDTLADYTVTEPMTDRELFCAVNNLKLMAEYCQDNGRQFRFMIAPNKNALYPQYMRNFSVAAETSDAQRLLKALADAGVQTIDLFTAFGEVSETLYFAHDSHWNSKGAALGADLINASFGLESSYYTDAFADSQPHTGDLFQMLYPALPDWETDPVYSGQLDYGYTSKATQPDAIVLTTESDNPGSLLVYRDSFCNLLFPYLADSYGNARFSRSTAYDLTPDADFVLVELVQRNLSYLYTYTPVMEAPVCQIVAPAGSEAFIVLQSAAKGELTQYSGTLPEMPAHNSKIYVIDSQGTAYETFCLAENGFALNLPKDISPAAVVFDNEAGVTCLYSVN